MKKLFVLAVIAALTFSNAAMAMDFGQSYIVISASGPNGPAPNSGDGVPDGSGMNSPSGSSQGSGPAPNSGDGVPDGSGMDSPSGSSDGR